MDTTEIESDQCFPHPVNEIELMRLLFLSFSKNRSSFAATKYQGWFTSPAVSLWRLHRGFRLSGAGQVLLRTGRIGPYSVPHPKYVRYFGKNARQI